MKKILLNSCVAAAVLTTSSIASAGDCTDKPRNEWMPELEMQKMILDQGWIIDKFKIDDSCYEIYGRDTNNNKVEIYFNPVNGEIVKKKEK